MYNLWNNNKQEGENRLSFSLAEFLYDQGLYFFIEPLSASGKADFVSSQRSEDPLIADAKIFSPEDSRGKEYIKKGFNQVYIYTRDYNKSAGYLIIFNISKKDLKFSLSNQTQNTQFVNHNNKTIFIIIIDISEYDTTASKRGILQSIEITENELITFIDESQKVE